jgi:glycosyltransferase involved in cell wall biosynthesis
VITIDWVSKVEKPGMNELNSHGYYSHIHQLYDACIRNELIKDDPNASIKLWICPLTWYNPVPGAFNVVYTMYEFKTIPPLWAEKLKYIDLLIVPNSFNKALFMQYTDKPIEIVWEGVGDDFKFQQREFPKDRPFRFLFFGAHNVRKGMFNLLSIWQTWNDLLKAKNENIKCELYIKSMNKQNNKKVHYMEEDSLYYDNRILTKSELNEMYGAAHAFLAPTMGEGFHLPLAEAARTGLPCIYSNIPGAFEWIDNDSGYPVNVIPVTARVIETDDTKLGKDKYYEFATIGHFPILQDFIQQMAYCFNNYKQALERGATASHMTNRVLTWDVSALDLIENIKRFCK